MRWPWVVTHPPRKTRFRLLVRLYRTGLVTRRVPSERFQASNYPPFPSFLGARSVHPLLREAPNRVLCNIVGGVISPLLANIFLHYVLDEWFEKDVRPRLKGEAFVIRYADDFVIGVAREDDARRIMEVLPKRMSKYGLTVHPQKTRLVRFQPPQADDSDTEGREPPVATTFDFLGFTHYWGRSQRGAWVVKRKTAASRLKR